MLKQMLFLGGVSCGGFTDSGRNTGCIAERDPRFWNFLFSFVAKDCVQVLHTRRCCCSTDFDGGRYGVGW